MKVTFYLPVALCLIIALAQPFLVEHYNADPWKLGAFRMFSKVSERILVFHGEMHDGSVHLISVKPSDLNYNVDPIHEIPLKRAEAFPSQSRLKSVLKDIYDMRVLKTGNDFNLVSSNDAIFAVNEKGQVLQPDQPDMFNPQKIFKSLGVSVWTVKFIPKDGKLDYVKTVEVKYSI